MARKTMQAWIQEALTDEDKEGKCTALVLVHFVGSTEREIHAVKFGGRQWTAKDLANLFRGKAETYSQDLTGVQEFCLLGFYNKGEPEARFPFRINGENDYGGLSTEGPTGTGLVQQAMRHTEAMVQACFRANASMHDNQAAMISSLSNMLQRTFQERNEAYELVTKLTLSITQGQHDGRMKELEFKRSSDERREMMRMLPALANTITGKEVFPQETADSALIDALIESLDEKGIETLASVVPKHLWGAMASRMLPVLERKKAQRDNDARILKSGVDPEVDAGGDVTESAAAE